MIEILVIFYLIVVIFHFSLSSLIYVHTRLLNSGSKRKLFAIIDGFVLEGIVLHKVFLRL